jgi:hypothetical protein
VSSVIYFNGSTDYVELFGYLASGWNTPKIIGSSVYTYLSGWLVRAA